jgi:hypothetical protein
MRLPLHRLRQDQRGNAVVEAAFVLPIFLLFILGVVEFGRLYWVRHSMQLAVTETGRYALIHTTATDTELTSVMANTMYGLNVENFDLTFTNQTTNGINYKVVNATYDYSFIAQGFLGLSPITLTASSIVPILP